MPLTLGISCFYHDAAAALIRDGEIVAAAQQERFSRIKHDPSFPIDAINYCIEEAGIFVSEVDAIVFYDKPALTFDRLIHSYLAVAPRGCQSWLTSMPRWLTEKLNIPKIIRNMLDYKGEILFTPHHLSHAASAFYPSPYNNAAILTVDGVGEWSTASFGIGEDTEVKLLKEMYFPDSLGLLYSAFTYFCGFKVNSGEYKLMGLAPYGESKYYDQIRNEIAKIHKDGSISLNMDYFGFLDKLEMVSNKFSKLFDGPARLPETRITQREMDLAASIQKFIEDAILTMSRFVFKETGKQNLCLAGGVALNCVANGRIVREGPFENIWIQPAAGDAGGALGAALAVEFGYHGVKRPILKGYDYQKGSYLGPSYSNDEVRSFLETQGYHYNYLKENENAITVAKALADGKIVGFFCGRMEFGPRALGARSILGDSRREDTQRIMNLKIKYRESFRPFAPSVLIERISDYFELETSSPYMLLVAPVKEERCIRQPLLDEKGDDLIALVNKRRSDIPAVTHIDYSARIQTVHSDTNPVYHKVIKEFEKLTGYGVIVNTSFNVRGEPIVCSPEDAYRCFMRTEMDYLYIDGFWLDKKQQPNFEDYKDWREEFDLD